MIPSYFPTFLPFHLLSTACGGSGRVGNLLPTLLFIFSRSAAFLFFSFNRSPALLLASL